MNKFLITGIPRSGTTIFTNTIANVDDVNVYTDSRGYGEPFKYMDETLDLNPYIRLNKAEHDCKSSYFGFKCFHGELLNLKEITEKRNYKTFAVIRKDIWKSILSHVVAKTKLFRDKEDTFKKSSTLHTQTEKFSRISDINPALRRGIADSMFYRAKECYEFETQWNNIDIIYFEDLIKPNASFDCVNKYFDQEIVFNLNYDDSHDAEAYYSNFDPSILEYFSNHFVNTINLPNDCPNYIRDSIYKYYKE